MIRSMTGFGAAADEVEGVSYSVELRSLNNKYFKATIRLPEELQTLEAEIEPILSRRLTRGSVIATIRFSDVSESAAGTINAAALNRYVEQLMAIDALSHQAARLDLAALLALPGVIIADTGEERLERARKSLIPVVNEACDKLIAMRIREGKTLLDELHRHGDRIVTLLAEIAERAPQVVQLFQERLRQRIDGLLAGLGTSVREEDLIREVAVFAERSDIAEEIVRLQGHLEQFREIIDADDNEPAGRTLDFLAQEMLREANTIASKSADVAISRRIVEIKGVIDRIKEQAANVE